MIWSSMCFLCIRHPSKLFSPLRPGKEKEAGLHKGPLAPLARGPEAKRWGAPGHTTLACGDSRGRGPCPLTMGVLGELGGSPKW